MLNMMRLHGAWFKQKLGMWIWIFFFAVVCFGFLFRLLTEND